MKKTTLGGASVLLFGASASAFLHPGSISSSPCSGTGIGALGRAHRCNNVRKMAGGSENCGCGPVEITFSGNPNEKARRLDHREAIRKHSIYSTDGTKVSIDDLIGDPSNNQVSVVVFLRSLG